MSICPKNRTSKARKNKRMPHRVCKNCGSYNKETIIEQTSEAK